MSTYQVIKPAVLIQDATGAQHMLYEKAVFDSAGYNADHVKMLDKEGFVEKFTAPEPEADDQGPKPGTAAFILAEVGDDKAKAQAALDAENAKEKPGKGLVADLEKILSA